VIISRRHEVRARQTVPHGLRRLLVRAVLALSVASWGCGRFGFESHLLPASSPNMGGADSDGDAGGDDGSVSGDGDQTDAGAGAGDGDASAAADGGAHADAGAAGDGDAAAASGCVGRLVCTGFEHVAGESDYTIDVEGVSNVSEQTGPVHSGVNSLGATTVQQGTHARAVFDLGTLDASDIYARVWFYVPPVLITGRVMILYLGNQTDDISGVNYNVNSDGSLDLYFPVAGGTRVRSAADVVPFGRWFCLQTHLVQSHTSGSAEAFIDGTSVVASSSNKDTQPDQGLNGLLVGVNWTELGQSTTSVSFDDVALDTSPVPCQ
jgi:hypothetical protein